MKNKMIDINTLSKEERKAVRDGKPVRFKNACILDEDRKLLWVYTREGERYFTDSGMAEFVAPYEWYVDKNGDAVTDDIYIRKHVRMAALVYALCGGKAAVWYIDENGNKELDLTMLILSVKSKRIK